MPDRGNIFMWLLESSIRQIIETAQASGGMAAEHQLAYEARYSSESGDTPRLLTLAGGSARIAVVGVMTNRPNYTAYYYGGGNPTYGDIQAALAAADADPKVTETEFFIDSGGGTIDGLFDTLAAIEAHSKPLRVTVANTAASAAYAIAAQAGNITALNPATRFGSVGIVASAYVSANEVTITSTNAPKKAPDLATAAGKATAIEELDAMHTIFAESIAAGRGTTVEAVNTNYGQGAVLLANEALSRGMIDSVAGKPAKLALVSSNSATALRGENPETRTMDLATLQASHPDVYAAVVEVGKQAGITQERERVSAHAVGGEMSGDVKTAMAAIKDGTECTQSVQMAYMMAGMNRKDDVARQDETDAAGDAVSAPAAADDTTRDQAASAALLAATAEACGIELEA